MGDLQKLLENDIFEFDSVESLYTILNKHKLLAKYTFPKNKSSDGYYHIAIRLDNTKGGRKHVKAHSISELEDKVYTILTEPVIQQGTTFREVFDKAQKQKLKYVKNPEKIMSVNNSILRERNEYNRYFSGSDFEKIPVGKISESDIDDFCYEILCKNDIKRKAFLFLRSILKGVFSYAFKNRMIDEDPYLRVDFKKYNDMITPSAPIEKRAHTVEEMKKMMLYTRNKQQENLKYLAPYAFELQVMMGLRIGEVPPLQWDDVKRNEGFILIHREQLMVKKGECKEKQSCEIVGHTKTWKDRRFPITEEIEEFLGRLKNVLDAYYPGSEFLFPSRDNILKPIHNHSIYNYYRTMCKKLGITLSHDFKKGPHSFRRNAITRVINSSGGNILMASKLFGNSPKVANANYYVGLNLAEAKEILEMQLYKI